MARLINKTSGIEVASEVEVASGFFSRMAGLLGRPSMAKGSALWIKRCDSVHTWFMRFSIDAVFVDERLVATRVYRNLRPWRVTLPQLARRSVFELPAGTLAERPVARGDQLHVGD
jgi:uncharacterized membrane protein (UPF0127 family)